MKPRLLELLACPSCGSPLDLTVFTSRKLNYSDLNPADRVCKRRCGYNEIHAEKETSGEEQPDCRSCYSTDIIDGMLKCRSCSTLYPVAGGIPRFLPDACRMFKEHYEEFMPLQTDAQSCNSGKESDSDRFHKLFDSTRVSFSAECFDFKRIEFEKENTTRFFCLTGKDEQFFRGKLSLDCGCGPGRHSRLVAMFGGEVVGIDMGGGVELAHRLTENLPFTHYVQGSIFSLPFAAENFDYVYSTGVLHHTPSPREAFLSISRMVRPGGELFIWVYSKEALKRTVLGSCLPSSGYWIPKLRSWTTKLPLWYLKRLCHLLSYYPYFPGARLLDPLFSTHESRTVRALQNFDMYSPPYNSFHTNDEVKEWFKAAGFGNISFSAMAVGVAGVKA